MKICKIYIKGYQQFQDVILDFTHPETGEPLDKICFIGSNGTGKSKILTIISYSIHKLREEGSANSLAFDIIPLIVIVYKEVNRYITHFISDYQVEDYIVESQTDVIPQSKFKALENGDYIRDYLADTKSHFNRNWKIDVYEELKLAPLLHIISSTESITNKYLGVNDVPETTVDEATKLFDNLPFFAIVSPATVKDFWTLLVYNLRRRAEERENYENLPENLNKTKSTLIEEFDKNNPKVLDRLNIVWDKILSKVHLKFDLDGVNNPYQLKDNLKAYIKLVKSDTVIPYRDLSTGIRNYIFRLGHIFSLYFGRDIDKSLLLVDEPENGLFPDFVIDLLDIYKQITTDKRGQNNTQMIFATHNELFAAQFEPFERVILNWNEDGSVSASKGVSPIGDDPNDILVNDFQSEIINKAGKKQWNEYIELKKKLIRASDNAEKEQLRTQINKIGRLYNYAE